MGSTHEANLWTGNFEGALYQYRVRTEFAGPWWQDMGVVIWTEGQRDDMLLTGVPHFRVRTGYRNDHREPPRAQKLTGNMSCFVPLSPQVLGLAFEVTRRYLQPRNHDLLRSPG